MQEPIDGPRLHLPTQVEKPHSKSIFNMLLSLSHLQGGTLLVPLALSIAIAIASFSLGILPTTSIPFVRHSPRVLIMTKTDLAVSLKGIKLITNSPQLWSPMTIRWIAISAIIFSLCFFKAGYDGMYRLPNIYFYIFIPYRCLGFANILSKVPAILEHFLPAFTLITTIIATCLSTPGSTTRKILFTIAILLVFWSQRTWDESK